MAILITITKSVLREKKAYAIMKEQDYEDNSILIKTMMGYKMKARFLALICIFLCSYSSFIKGKTQEKEKPLAIKGLHQGPVVISASEIKSALYYPVKSYALFKTLADGTAEAIPVQIDEKDEYEDYILHQGPNPNTKSSNKIFDGLDELAFMGSDVGIKQVPKKWPFQKPNILYEINFFQGDSGKQVENAVYLGIYSNKKPEFKFKNYVNFDLDKSEVHTENYRYQFNEKNYLVVRGVDVEKEKGSEKIVLTSSVYLRLDLKYFLTLSTSHKDIETALDAYKIGPVRVIARVNFDYDFGVKKLDLGMYTEVSFFSNAVYLPAVVDNPINGKKTLRKDSYFYYGLALVENPQNIKARSNMSKFDRSDSYIKVPKNKSNVYWASAQGGDFMLYLEFEPSEQMIADGNFPEMFVQNIPGHDLKGLSDKPQPLGKKSPANFAVAFFLNKLQEGLHKTKLSVGIENMVSERVLDEFKQNENWDYKSTRLPAEAY